MIADQRRLLEVLAGSVNGSNLLIASGATLDVTVGLVRAGFTSATAERTFDGGKLIKMTWLQITDGRTAGDGITALINPRYVGKLTQPSVK